jgi:tetraacyldisaccharide 4'-kinase
VSQRVADAGVLERLWWGDGVFARAGRVALSPLALLYGAGVAVRGSLYDAGVLRSCRPRLPALSVGNLSVGGTGKTPVSAWFAAQLSALGARPAIVLRGYGDDEPHVHRVLNPYVPVVVKPDRLAGIAQAEAMGSDVAVLDDAFQHRRTRRTADVVLVSADRWTTSRHYLLPAGPWREPLRALRRASLALVTRKAQSLAAAARVRAELARAAPGVPSGVLRLAMGPLRTLDGPESIPSEALAGQHVLAIAAVADPRAFVAQLEASGAVVRARLFADHHRFTPNEVARLASDLAREERAVCTLKDAVKLAPFWPREASPLWYVSQQLEVEQGREDIDAVIARTLAARHTQP